MAAASSRRALTGSTKWRQRHLAADRHQQRIVEHFPQPRERPAGGRLAEMQALTGTRNAHFRKQRVERYEQVQI
jgi:hypothetical protein